MEVSLPRGRGRSKLDGVSTLQIGAGIVHVEDIEVAISGDGPAAPQPEPEEQINAGGSGAKSVRYVLECPLPDVHPNIVELAVAEDAESGGVFILDPGSCGKSWSCVSTRAATTIKLPPSVLKVITLYAVLPTSAD